MCVYKTFLRDLAGLVISNESAYGKSTSLFSEAQRQARWTCALLTVPVDSENSSLSLKVSVIVLKSRLP